MTGPDARSADPFETAILSLNQDSVAAFNRGDAAACAAYYAEDAILLLPGRAVVRGRAAIRTGLAELIGQGVELMPVDPVRIEASDEMGCCAGTYRFRTRTGTATVEESGKFVTVFRRGADGIWSAIIDTFFADAESGR